MLIDEAGTHRQRIRNGEKFAKARSWRTTLVSSDDARKASTVRWLFQTYADTDTGLRNLADQLNARGVPGPTGGPWYAASIKAIFENRNYAGTFTWAKRREGKYHSVAAGQIRERDRSEITLSPAGKPLAVDNRRKPGLSLTMPMKRSSTRRYLNGCKPKFMIAGETNRASRIERTLVATMTRIFCQGWSIALIAVAKCTEAR